MKIILEKNVAEDIIEFAKTKYPHEFVSYISGKVIGKEIRIDGLIYQHFKSTETSAILSGGHLPMLSNNIGTVHSHPGKSYKPSGADSRLFNKQGGVHFIIAYPYRFEDIHAFSVDLEELEFEIQ